MVRKASEEAETESGVQQQGAATDFHAVAVAVAAPVAVIIADVGAGGRAAVSVRAGGGDEGGGGGAQADTEVGAAPRALRGGGHF